MKKQFLPLLSLAVLAGAGLSSCNKQDLSEPVQQSFKIVAHAEVEDPANGTKTYINESDKWVYWQADEAMQVLAWADDAANSSYINLSCTTAADQKTAIFTGTAYSGMSAGTYSVAGVYPMSAHGYTTDATAYTATLPAAQTATASSYDPAAFIMVTKKATMELTPGADAEFSLYFVRAIALNKMTLKNVAEGITSVTVTFPETVAAAGTRAYDLTGDAPVAGTISSESNSITVSYAEAQTVSELPVWFTSWGVELAAEEAFTVAYTTASATYTRTVTIPDTRSLTLKENYLNYFSVDMSSATEVAAPDYSGDYLVLGRVASSGIWHYMSGEFKTAGSGNYLASVATSVTVDVADVKCSDFYDVTGIENQVWTLTKTENGMYTIFNSTAGYLSLSDNNVVLTPDNETPTSLSVENVAGYEYTIKSGPSASYSLRFNASATRFRPYISGQNEVYMLPWVANTEPSILVTENEVTVAATATSAEFTYTTQNIPEGAAISASATTNPDGMVTAVSAADGTLVITLVPNTNTAERTASISLSYNEVVLATVSVTQKAYVDPSSAITYALQTSEGAFVDGGKYIFAFYDPADQGYYFLTKASQNSNLTKNALVVKDDAISVNTEEEVANYVYIATASGDGFTFANSDGVGMRYSKTTLYTDPTSGTATVWSPEFLTASSCYKITDGTRYISMYPETPNARTYLNSNFIDQVADGSTSLKQYHGAMYVFKLSE